MSPKKLVNQASPTAVIFSLQADGFVPLRLRDWKVHTCFCVRPIGWPGLYWRILEFLVLTLLFPGDFCFKSKFWLLLGERRKWCFRFKMVDGYWQHLHLVDGPLWFRLISHEHDSIGIHFFWNLVHNLKPSKLSHAEGQESQEYTTFFTAT